MIGQLNSLLPPIRPHTSLFYRQTFHPITDIFSLLLSILVPPPRETEREREEREHNQHLLLLLLLALSRLPFFQHTLALLPSDADWMQTGGFPAASWVSAPFLPFFPLCIPPFPFPSSSSFFQHLKLLFFCLLSFTPSTPPGCGTQWLCSSLDSLLWSTVSLPSCLSLSVFHSVFRESDCSSILEEFGRWSPRCWCLIYKVCSGIRIAGSRKETPGEEKWDSCSPVCFVCLRLNCAIFSGC